VRVFEHLIKVLPATGASPLRVRQVQLWGLQLLPLTSRPVELFKKWVSLDFSQSDSVLRIKNQQRTEQIEGCHRHLFCQRLESGRVFHFIHVLRAKRMHARQHDCEVDTKIPHVDGSAVRAGLATTPSALYTSSTHRHRERSG